MSDHYIRPQRIFRSMRILSKNALLYILAVGNRAFPGCEFQEIL